MCDTGGAFYKPETAVFPAGYFGDYFFADLCSGSIRRLDPVTKNVSSFKASSDEMPADLKVSKEGDFTSSLGAPGLSKISYMPPRPLRNGDAEQSTSA